MVTLDRVDVGLGMPKVFLVLGIDTSMMACMKELEVVNARLKRMCI